MGNAKRTQNSSANEKVTFNPMFTAAQPTIKDMETTQMYVKGEVD